MNEESNEHFKLILSEFFSIFGVLHLRSRLFSSHFFHKILVIARNALWPLWSPYIPLVYFKILSNLDTRRFSPWLKYNISSVIDVMSCYSWSSTLFETEDWTRSHKESNSYPFKMGHILITLRQKIALYFIKITSKCFQFTGTLMTSLTILFSVRSFFQCSLRRLRKVHTLLDRRLLSISMPLILLYITVWSTLSRALTKWRKISH